MKCKGCYQNEFTRQQDGTVKCDWCGRIEGTKKIKEETVYRTEDGNVYAQLAEMSRMLGTDIKTTMTMPVGQIDIIQYPPSNIFGLVHEPTLTEKFCNFICSILPF